MTFKYNVEMSSKAIGGYMPFSLILIMNKYLTSGQVSVRKSTIS